MHIGGNFAQCKICGIAYKTKEDLRKHLPCPRVVTYAGAPPLPIPSDSSEGITRDVAAAAAGITQLTGDVAAVATEPAPIPLLLWCPGCGVRHIDRGTFATRSHKTHACQTCGMVWRPAVEPTVGVAFLPGFKDA